MLKLHATPLEKTVAESQFLRYLPAKTREVCRAGVQGLRLGLEQCGGHSSLICSGCWWSDQLMRNEWILILRGEAFLFISQLCFLPFGSHGIGRIGSTVTPRGSESHCTLQECPCPSVLRVYAFYFRPCKPTNQPSPPPPLFQSGEYGAFKNALFQRMCCISSNRSYNDSVHLLKIYDVKLLLLITNFCYIQVVINMSDVQLKSLF